MNADQTAYEMAQVICASHLPPHDLGSIRATLNGAQFEPSQIGALLPRALAKLPELRARIRSIRP